MSMSSAFALGGATASKPLSFAPPQNHRSRAPKHKQLHSPKPHLICHSRIQVNTSLSLRSLPPLHVSSNDAHFNSVPEENQLQQQQQQQSSFTEFITSERVKVVAMLALALALCNADRVVMSVAIVPLSLANGWTRSFSGIVQSSFLWGYLVSPIAGGVLVDNYGGKVVMAWGVALWSLATFLTPWAAETSLLALLAVRALLGMAEGVALPCMNNMVARAFSLFFLGCLYTSTQYITWISGTQHGLVLFHGL